MKSKRSQEGYLMVDHRACLMSDVPTGLPKLLETKTYTCKHCCRILISNPMRTKERAYCFGCDHYICDQCEVNKVITGKCETFMEMISRMEKKQTSQSSDIIIVSK